MSEQFIYAIRVDGQDPAPLKQVSEKYGGAYIIVRECSDGNHHFHSILHTGSKMPAVRQFLKRLLPSSGNGAYSVAAVRDVAKYQRYMMKGDSKDVMPDVVAASGWSYQDPSWVEEQHDAYWDENELLTSKRKAEPIAEVVLQKCKEAKYCWTSRERIAGVYIRELVARNKAINLFSLKSQINLIQVKLCPDDRAIDDLAAQV